MIVEIKGELISYNKATCLVVLKGDIMISDLEKRMSGILPWQGEINHSHLSMNFNSAPLDSNMVILVTSFIGHLPFLEATLRNYRLTGKFVLLAYDPPWRGWGVAPLDRSLPKTSTLLLSNAIVFKHVTIDCDKRNGYFWDLKYASGIIKMFDNFKYVFCVNGDCLFEKPDGVDEIISLLGDGDLMSSSSCDVTTHTCSVIYKSDAFNAVIDYMTDVMEKPILGSHSPECMLKDAITELNLKEIKAPKQPMEPEADLGIDHYNRYGIRSGQASTWGDILGYRNLTAEQQTASVERLAPVEAELCDWETGNGAFLNSHEQATLYNYYKTGDARWLYAFWDQGEESWFDRQYRPIDHYGPEPIYNEPPNFFKNDGNKRFRNLDRIKLV